jgi:hypothetical protein
MGGTRNALQCYNRWETTQEVDILHNFFTKEENELLSIAVSTWLEENDNLSINWKAISTTIRNLQNNVMIIGITY